MRSGQAKRPPYNRLIPAGAGPASHQSMRRIILLLATVLALNAIAAPQPLPLKEISLMLRSGYSSQDVLREIAQRRVLEPLDPTSRKSLAASGASPELLQALDTGAYRVDDATAEASRRAALEATARQSAEAENIFRNAISALRDQRARASASEAAPASQPLLSALRDKLVICRDGVVTPFDPAAVENKKLIAFYFSAHWCAPCRKFTPTLVDYYQRVAPQHPEFELIFVSSDRSRFNWETYLRDMKMPWPAIDFDQLPAFTSLKKRGGESIPSLLILDATGHVVASSYEGEKYQGPQSALATLDKIFAANAAPVASVP